MSVRTWDPAIAKSVEEFCKLDMKSNIEWVVSALNALTPDVCALQHDYQLLQHQQTCQRSLIRLGNKLLDDFVTVEGKHPEIRIEKACHQFLACILERGEFSIEGLGLVTSSDLELKGTVRQIARAYRRLLIRTEKYVCKKLQKTSKFDTATIHFCMQVLSMCYFYLPETRSHLLSSCSVAPGLAMQRCAPDAGPKNTEQPSPSLQSQLPDASPYANSSVSFFAPNQSGNASNISSISLSTPASISSSIADSEVEGTVEQPKDDPTSSFQDKAMKREGSSPQMSNSLTEAAKKKRLVSLEFGESSRRHLPESGIILEDEEELPGQPRASPRGPPRIHVANPTKRSSSLLDQREFVEATGLEDDTGQKKRPSSAPQSPTDSQKRDPFPLLRPTSFPASHSSNGSPGDGNPGVPRSSSVMRVQRRTSSFLIDTDMEPEHHLLPASASTPIPDYRSTNLPLSEAIPNLPQNVQSVSSNQITPLDTPSSAVAETQVPDRRPLSPALGHRGPRKNTPQRNGSYRRTGKPNLSLSMPNLYQTKDSNANSPRGTVFHFTRQESPQIQRSELSDKEKAVAGDSGPRDENGSSDERRRSLDWDRAEAASPQPKDEQQGIDNAALTSFASSSSHSLNLTHQKTTSGSAPASTSSSSSSKTRSIATSTQKREAGIKSGAAETGQQEQSEQTEIQAVANVGAIAENPGGILTCTESDAQVDEHSGEDSDPDTPGKVSFFVDPAKPWQQKMMRALRRLGRARSVETEEILAFRENHRTLFCWGSWFEAKIDMEELRQSPEYRSKDWTPSLDFRFLSAFQVFEFMRLVLETVLRVVGSQDEVVWDAIPGYWTLFELIVERSMILSTKMDAPLLACYSTMALNLHGVGFLTQVLLHGTRLNEGAPHPVLQTLDRISHWIRLASPPGDVLEHPLPASFCWDTLFEALSRCLGSRHHLVLLAVLVFMYVHAGNFERAQRRRFFMLLMEPRVFHKLFDHWHWQTRRIYMHWLVYRRLRGGLISSEQAQRARETGNPGFCGLFNCFAPNIEMQESVIMAKKLPSFVKGQLEINEEELETDRLLEEALQHNLAAIRRNIQQHSQQLQEAQEKDRRIRGVDWGWAQERDKQSSSQDGKPALADYSSDNKEPIPPVPKRSAFLFPSEQTSMYGEEALRQYHELLDTMQEAQRIAAPFLGPGMMVFPREVSVPPRQHRHVIEQALLGSLSNRNPYRLSRKDALERRERTRGLHFTEERVVFDEVDSVDGSIPSISTADNSFQSKSDHSSQDTPAKLVKENMSVELARTEHASVNRTDGSHVDTLSSKDGFSFRIQS